MSLDVPRRLVAEGGRGGNANRAAAVLGRAELERLVDLRVAARHPGIGNASERSKLIVLGCDDPAAGALAATAWAGLSAACHHHAYDLSPTAAEVIHLLELVQRFADTETVGPRS